MRRVPIGPSRRGRRLWRLGPARLLGPGRRHPDRAPGVNRESTPVLLLLSAVVSVQFGGAVAATLVPQVGAAGSVLLRLGIGALVLVVAIRPKLRGHSWSAWRTVVLFGLALGAMNWSFYASLARLPIGVAVTVEFLGPLTLAAAQSRRAKDMVAVAAAGGGVLLISQALTTRGEDLDLAGIGLALVAGACWAAYVVLSQRTGAAFPGLDGLAAAMLVAVALVVPAGLASVPLWDSGVLAKGVAVAMLSSVLPYSLELVALRRLSQQAFGILLSLEPAVAALAGFAVLGQTLGPTQLGGMALVVAASALVMGANVRRDPAEGSAT